VSADWISPLAWLRVCSCACFYFRACVLVEPRGEFNYQASSAVEFQAAQLEALARMEEVSPQPQLQLQLQLQPPPQAESRRQAAHSQPLATLHLLAHLAPATRGLISSRRSGAIGWLGQLSDGRKWPLASRVSSSIQPLLTPPDSSPLGSARLGSARLPRAETSESIQF